jgi:hypothetical protein
VFVDDTACAGGGLGPIRRSAPYIRQHDRHPEEHEWGDDASRNKEFPEFSFHEYSSPN